MSGIIAVFNRNREPVDPDSMRAMLEKMQHRGPDRQSIWHHDAAGLAHCLLITTPEGQYENQPCFDQSGGVAVTADARIDNRPELFRKFGYKPGEAANIPDSRLILQAYLEWGDHCVDYLSGNYAVAVIDQRQQRLFCFRDHLGVRPLYYHLSSGVCVIASDVNAILAHPGVPKIINEGRIADYFISQLEGINKTETFYRDIYRLPPAHMLHVGHSTSRIDEYWSPAVAKPVYSRDEREYADVFNDKLRQSVGVCLHSEQEPAVLLSGGVDSSAVFAIATDIRNSANLSPLRAVSGLSNDGDDCVESRFIRLVEQHVGGDLLSLTADDLPRYDEELSALFHRLGEPFDAMTMILLLYNMASRHDSRVVLDGVEGDMVHSLSWDYPASLLRRMQFAMAFREINGIWENHEVRQSKKTKLFVDYLRMALIPNSLRRWRYQHSRTLLQKLALPGTIINPVFAEQVGLNDRLKEFQSNGRYGPASDPVQQQIDSIRHGYLPAALERYDRVAALCSIEPRHPLLDKRLVEYSVELPWDWKTRDGWSKYVLRKTAARYLPGEIAWRRGREHLGWSFTSNWMQLRNGTIQETIIRCLPAIERFVDVVQLRKILNNYNAGPGSPEEGLLWHVYQFATWYERQ